MHVLYILLVDAEKMVQDREVIIFKRKGVVEFYQQKPASEYWFGLRASVLPLISPKIEVMVQQSRQKFIFMYDID